MTIGDWVQVTTTLLTLGTLFALWRQLKSQGASNAAERLELLVDRWRARNMLQARLAVAKDVSGAGATAIEWSADMNEIAYFFTLLWAWKRKGHISIEEIDNYWGGEIFLWNKLLETRLSAERNRLGNPWFCCGLDDLAYQIIEWRTGNDFPSPEPFLLPRTARQKLQPVSAPLVRRIRRLLRRKRYPIEDPVALEQKRARLVDLLEERLSREEKP